VEQFAVVNSKKDAKADEIEAITVPSLLADEFRMLGGSLGGDEFADSSDWSDAIKNSKSLSRLALMVQCFLSFADETLNQMKEERDLLDSILGINAKRTSRHKKTYPTRTWDSSTSIWANCITTNKLVKAKVQGFPYWPAHRCEPFDSVVADGLSAGKHTLIASVGNPAMYMVAEKDLVDFAEETKEDLSMFDKATLDEMQGSMDIAKKLWRSRNHDMASPWKKSAPKGSPIGQS